MHTLRLVLPMPDQHLTQCFQGVGSRHSSPHIAGFCKRRNRNLRHRGNSSNPGIPGSRDRIKKVARRFCIP